jgi:hypothetical protein
VGSSRSLRTIALVQKALTWNVTLKLALPPVEDRGSNVQLLDDKVGAQLHRERRRCRHT